MAIWSFSPSCSTSRCRLHCTSGSLFGCLHGAGDVDQEDQVAGRPPRLVDRLGGDADPRQPVLGIPRDSRRSRRAPRTDARLESGGGASSIGEVIEQLLDADGVLGRQHVLGEEAADIRVAGRIDVDRERRQRFARRRVERIVDDRRCRTRRPARGSRCNVTRVLGSRSRLRPVCERRSGSRSAGRRLSWRVPPVSLSPRSGEPGPTMGQQWEKRRRKRQS